MTGIREALLNIAPCDDHTVQMADGHIVVGTEAGDLKIADGPLGIVHNVVYIPSLAQTLLSASVLTTDGYKCDFGDNGCTVYGPPIFQSTICD
ncbi:hypothetical protein ON010_g3264 [Phytophthora cinnamomi]|nr:hypothetical protein ON010_g3264 [Phytophthora cinnamomi]